MLSTTHAYVASGNAYNTVQADNNLFTERVNTSYNPDTNITTIEIFINDTVEKGSFRWRAAMCNLQGADNVTKSEYNPATDVWTNTGALQFGALVNFGMPANWCNNTAGQGYVLFGAGSGDRTYRLHIEGNDFDIELYSGDSTEILNTGTLTFTYELLESIEGRTYTEQCFTCSLPVNITLIDAPSSESTISSDRFVNGFFSEVFNTSINFDYAEILTQNNISKPVPISVYIPVTKNGSVTVLDAQTIQVTEYIPILDQNTSYTVHLNNSNNTELFIYDTYTATSWSGYQYSVVAYGETFIEENVWVNAVTEPQNLTIGESIIINYVGSRTPKTGKTSADFIPFLATGNNNFTMNALAWWNSSWQKKFNITFDNSGSAENLTNFPVLVVLNSSRINYSLTQNNGEDLRFIDADESTVLDHEIEIWNESGTSYIWVEVPQIDAGSTTDHIWLYYNNSAAADGQDAAGTWNSNYVMVHHFNEGSGNVTDSTSNNNDGVVSSQVVRNQAGIAGYAHEYDSNGAQTNIPDNGGFDGIGDQTISGWVNVNTLNSAGNAGMFGKVDSGSTISFSLINGDPTTAMFQGFISGTGSDFPCSFFVNDVFTSGEWMLVALSMDASTLCEATKNGTVVATDNAGIPATSFDGNANVTFGGNQWLGAIPLNATYDEFRFSNVVRSSDWLEAEFLTGTDAFNTYGNAINVTTDTCTYGGSGDWVIEMSDNCVLTTNYNITGRINFTGSSGSATFNASSINTTGLDEPPNNTTMRIGSNLLLRIGGAA